MSPSTGWEKLVRVTQLLFLLNATFWFVLGAINLASIAGISGQVVGLMVLGVLMLANGAALLAAGLGLGRPRRWRYFFAVALVLANLVLTVTDEFGLLDFVVLALNAILLVLLLVVRKHFTAE